MIRIRVTRACISLSTFLVCDLATVNDQVLQQATLFEAAFGFSGNSLEEKVKIITCNVRFAETIMMSSPPTWILISSLISTTQFEIAAKGPGSQPWQGGGAPSVALPSPEAQAVKGKSLTSLFCAILFSATSSGGVRGGAPQGQDRSSVVSQCSEDRLKRPSSFLLRARYLHRARLISTEDIRYPTINLNTELIMIHILISVDDSFTLNQAVGRRSRRSGLIARPSAASEAVSR
uniref:Secreted protein n=1 Tax=Panagrellus redivivus TaxID=6233 RepID=A0A7E4VHK8_PANRE